jgi:hypothetical protein
LAGYVRRIISQRRSVKRLLDLISESLYFEATATRHEEVDLQGACLVGLDPSILDSLHRSSRSLKFAWFVLISGSAV